jgi:Icc-related predicted phosphoesterase
VWVNHGPPFDTIGDLTHRNERVGSKALRNFIAERMPDITLHGHIHESVKEHGNEAFTSRIKNTLVASSGNDFMNDVCHGIFFETNDIAGTVSRFEVKVKESNSTY